MRTRLFTGTNHYRDPLVLIGVSVMLVFMFVMPAAATVQEEWQFDVYLDDKAIGEHTFSVSRAQGSETIRTEANFNVKLFFITAFSYEHQNIEKWQNGCLAEIDATTVINGKQSVVQGQLDNANFKAQTNDDIKSFEGCVSTFAYWNENFLNNDKLLNSQTGQLDPVKVENLGTESFAIQSDQVLATRYEITVDNNPINLWYAQDGRWLGLETLAKGGRVLRYEPTVLPDSRGLGAD